MSLRFRTAQEFLDEKLPTQPWIIDELLPGDGWSMLIAPTRTGKSLLAMQLAASLAIGGSFLGRPAPMLRTAYIQLDAPPGNWQEQIAKLPAHARKFATFTRNDLPLYLLTPEPSYMGPRSLLRKVLKDNGVEFVVWDALEKLTRMDLNLKDACQRTWDKMYETFPGPSLVVHHPRKSREGESRADMAAGNHYLLADASGQWFLTKTGKFTGTLDVNTRSSETTLKLEREPETYLWLPAKPAAPKPQAPKQNFEWKP